ncbi:hypothetical protein N7504_009023 [Penicillium tannophilum]|nr:hypothetical protein N7504_009023 [Penicillium tannophilum]
MLSALTPITPPATQYPHHCNLPVGENYHYKISNVLLETQEPREGICAWLSSLQQARVSPQQPNRRSQQFLPREELTKAAETHNIYAKDPYLQEARGNVEMIVAYAPIAGGGSVSRVPMDGKHISSPVVLLLPTSRGSITLANTDPSAHPELIRIPRHRDGSCRDARGDADLDRRVQIVGSSFFQNGRTAAMGSVVDTQCRVKSVNNLRVCDASVLPVPVAGHYQAPMYAFGEAVADMLLSQ